MQKSTSECTTHLEADVVEQPKTTLVDTQCQLRTTNWNSSMDHPAFWDIFSWHSLILLVPTEHCLNTKAYLTYCCWPFPCRYDPSVLISSFTKFISLQTGFLDVSVSSLCSNGLHSKQIWIQKSTQQEIHIMDLKLRNLQHLYDAIMSTWTRVSEECLQHLVWICAIKKLDSSVDKRGPTQY